MRLRTVGVKLSLALIALVAGALAIVYIAVVPTLENRLVDGRTSQLQRTVDSIILDYTRAENDPGFIMRDFVLAESQVRGVRVTVYEFLNETPVFLRSYADSRPIGQSDDRDAVAQRAAEHSRTTRGVVQREGIEFAEVAAPFGGAYILLVSAPLDDTLENVSLVRERFLAAGALALIVAALVGFLLSRIFARRIQRLERAADRIAGGRFDEPVVDRSTDELGELAVAFDRMREQLAALERARREFIANASHELRTPIFALGGQIELLTDEDMDEETQRDFLAEMRLQVERLTRLATDLLDLSRLDAGRLHVEMVTVDLAEIATSLASEFGGVGRGRDHVLEVESGSPASALADEERVRQIGRILVENAILHTPPGTEIRLATSDSPEGAAFRVQDNGPGVPADEQGHVFERFYRAGDAVSSGSGLGLAIAQELASLMGGRIELDSRPGHTLFTLRLPRSPAEVEDRAPALVL